MTFATLDDAIRFWKEASESEEFLPELVLADHDKQSLHRFLNRLTGTAEYKNPHTKKFLAERVLTVLSWLTTDNPFKEMALAKIHDAVTTCDDRVIFSLNELEIAQQVSKISNDPDAEESAVREIGIGVLRLEMVHEKAKAHMESLNFVDPIEVHLAFQLALKEKLELPIKTTQMIFRNMVTISDDGIRTIGDQILAECTDEKIEAFLEDWDPWQQRQRSKKVPAYKSLAAYAGERLDLTCCISQETPTQPVICNGDVYDFENLQRIFIDQGWDIARQPIDWSKVQKVQNVTTNICLLIMSDQKEGA